MIKWLILIAIAGVVILLGIKVIRTMWKTEKESEGKSKSSKDKKSSGEKSSSENVVAENPSTDNNGKEYVPLEPLGDIKQTLPIDNTLPNIPKPNKDVLKKDFEIPDIDLDEPRFDDFNSSEFSDFNSNDNFDFASSGFTDHEDEEFFDYSRHMRNRKKRKPVDFDLEGEMADDFEYIPSSPDFSYLHNHRPPKKKPTLEKSLNEMPTELKVLMLSDIFDRKFFD